MALLCRLPRLVALVALYVVLYSVPCYSLCLAVYCALLSAVPCCLLCLVAFVAVLPFSQCCLGSLVAFLVSYHVALLAVLDSLFPSVQRCLPSSVFLVAVLAVLSCDIRVAFCPM